MIDLSVARLKQLFPELTYKQARALILFGAGVNVRICANNDNTTSSQVNALISRATERLCIKKSDITSIVILRLLIDGVN